MLLVQEPYSREKILEQVDGGGKTKVKRSVGCTLRRRMELRVEGEGLGFSGLGFKVERLRFKAEGKGLKQTA